MRVEARLERVGGEERERVGVDSFSTSLALKGRRIRVVAARSFAVKAFFFFNGSDLNLFKCQWEGSNQEGEIE